MKERVRILLLESNRYRSLMIARALQDEFGSAVVARFESEADARRQLMSFAYDVAIINTEAIAGRPVHFLQTVSLAQRRLALIALGRPETPQSVVGALESVVDEYLVWRDGMAEAIPDAVRSAVRTSGLREILADISAEPDDEPAVLV